VDFSFSQEQQQLQALLQRFVANEYSFAARQKRLHEGATPRQMWHQLAQLGLVGVTLPEAYGGLGGGAVEVLVVMEAFGRGLVVEPFVPTVLLGAGLMCALGSDEQKAAVLPAVVAGERQLALAHDEPGGRYERDGVATTARPQGDGYVLDGQKEMVLAGHGADQLIVSARSGGGMSLFLVDARAAGVTRQAQATCDGHGAARVQLAGVRVGAGARLGGEGEAAAALERAIDGAIAALCAEAVGCMSALLQQTVEYLKMRRQFGGPIGRFQVLQHRVAEMFIHGEQARSMAYLAAAKVDASDAVERRRALSAAKSLVGRAARFVGQEAVQLHGGMGVTDELPVGHYLKRLTAINLTFGDAEHHLGRFSDLLLGERA
jgi:alkylation response protein AidB-like acyl-CoA dehydrogenase